MPLGTTCQDRPYLPSSQPHCTLEQVLGDADPDRAQRAMQAMLGMVKIDLEQLRRAADGVPAS